MKIVVASDSFKGSLSSQEVGEAAVQGILSVMPDAEVVVIPVADGGEGTAETIARILGGSICDCVAEGPLGESVKAYYAIAGRTAVIEMAVASGLTLIPEHKRNPEHTSSYGTGQLIADALNRGCDNMIICIGGSATNDGGVGMLQALGWSFYDNAGAEVGRGGINAGKVQRIKSSPLKEALSGIRFTVACDVRNPLTGPRGASRIFGPQKGADEKMVERLEASLCHFADVVAEQTGLDYSGMAGAGAAGGLGFALKSFLGAELVPGAELVLDTIGFNELIKDADLIITGEGRLDRQTLMGKIPYEILRRGMENGIPVIAIGGRIEKEAENLLVQAGFSEVYGVTNESTPLEVAMIPEMAKKNIENTVSDILKGRAGTIGH